MQTSYRFHDKFNKSNQEAILIKWSDVLSASAEPIPKSLKADLAEHYTEAEIVELTLLVGATVMLNRYATALSLPVDPTHLDFLKSEDLAEL